MAIITKINGVSVLRPRSYDSPASHHYYIIRDRYVVHYNGYSCIFPTNKVHAYQCMFDLLWYLNIID